MAKSNRSKRPRQPDFLSPRALAEAIGVSESSIKRWADEGRLTVERTAGGHRRIPVGGAVRFIRQAGLTPIRPELLGVGGAEAQAVAADPGGAAERLHAALVRDGAAEARGLILSLYLGGSSLGWICDEVIRDALARVGTLWREDASGVFLEHRAMETCARALDEVRRLLPAPEPAAPVALGGAAEGDVYRLPTAMAALVLAETGFRDRDLGADTPAEALVAAIDRHRPRLVWQSFSVPAPDGRAAPQGLERIAEAMGPAALVVGGRAADGVPLPAHPRVHRLGSMAELAAFARGLVMPPARD